MINIVLIEDDEKDIQKISDTLIPLGEFLSYDLHSFSSIELGKDYIVHSNVQLILLDLEFTLLRKTSIDLIDQIDPAIPIIIVSNLTHYQRQLSLRANVVSFIPKVKIDRLLVRSIAEVLCDKNHERPEPADFFFPANSFSEIPEAVSIADTRWIVLSSFREYSVHLTSGITKTIKSSTFRDVVQALKDQGISSLQPISRNQIVNTKYIGKVYLEDNSRVSLRLVGSDTYLHVGKNYTDTFREWYIE